MQTLDSQLSYPLSATPDDEVAMVCGQIRARLASAGTPIGACDLLIAALAKLSEGIALANNLNLKSWRVKP